MFRKFFCRRFWPLPLCCKVPTYQSFRSFLVADNDLCLSVVKFPSYQSLRSFLVADTDLCLYVAKFPSCQGSRSFLVADTDLCLYVAKFPSYQSFRSFLVADTDLCLYVASSQVTRVPEVFWSQIPISACMLQVPKLPEFQKFFGRRYRSLPVCCKVTSY